MCGLRPSLSIVSSDFSEDSAWFSHRAAHRARVALAEIVLLTEREFEELLNSPA